ncbi:hypothetical protein TNCV_4098471 [Trichonephila clavipes]|nr:hypothetical protein TNCV_4098471 [Trichonephila clavipes]
MESPTHYPPPMDPPFVPDWQPTAVKKESDLIWEENYGEGGGRQGIEYSTMHYVPIRDYIDVIPGIITSVQITRDPAI